MKNYLYYVIESGYIDRLTSLQVKKINAYCKREDLGITIIKCGDYINKKFDNKIDRICNVLLPTLDFEKNSILIKVGDGHHNFDFWKDLLSEVDINYCRIFCLDNIDIIPYNKGNNSYIRVYYYDTESG